MKAQLDLSINNTFHGLVFDIRQLILLSVATVQIRANLEEVVRSKKRA